MADQVPAVGRDTPTLTTGQTAQRECENCGEYVTKQFARVFGDESGTVHACMNCSTGRQLRNGEGGKP